MKYSKSSPSTISIKSKIIEIHQVIEEMKASYLKMDKEIGLLKKDGDGENKENQDGN